MIIKITTLDNQTPQQGVKRILDKVVQYLKSNATKDIQNGLLWSVKNHVSTIYPGSKHYDPKKVTKAKTTSNEASINIDIPGICRAYHNHDIKPKSAKHLTIPMHQSAYGKKASNFSDLIYIKKKNGKEFLAQKQSDGQLTFIYFLANHVHQIKDRRLMPTNETLADNCFARIYAALKRI